MADCPRPRIALVSVEQRTNPVRRVASRQRIRCRAWPIARSEFNDAVLKGAEPVAAGAILLDHRLRAKTDAEEVHSPWTHPSHARRPRGRHVIQQPEPLSAGPVFEQHDIEPVTAELGRWVEPHAPLGERQEVTSSIDPHDAGAILRKRDHGAEGHAVDFMDWYEMSILESCRPTVFRADPKRAGAVDIERMDLIVRQSVRQGEVTEPSGVVAKQPILSPYPKRAVQPYCQGQHTIDMSPRLVHAFDDVEPQSVKAGEPAKRAEPDVAVGRLRYG